jgi:hypothetical protein
MFPHGYEFIPLEINGGPGIIILGMYTREVATIAIQNEHIGTHNLNRLQKQVPCGKQHIGKMDATYNNCYIM